VKSRDGCSWTPTAALAKHQHLDSRITRQAWITNSAAISAAGEGRAEDEDSSTFLCRSCHLSFFHHVFSVWGFWFLVCYATTQLAIQVQQERIQVVRSNKVARVKCPCGHSVTLKP